MRRAVAAALAAGAIGTGTVTQAEQVAVQQEQVQQDVQVVLDARDDLDAILAEVRGGFDD